MANSAGQQTLVQMLQAAGGGDERALNDLLQHSGERLRRLTSRMLKGSPLKRWTETDDVLQNALLRLSGALRAVQPQSPGQFLALATLQIRRELIDLARRFFGPHGIGANQDSRPPIDSASPQAPDRPDLSNEPCALAQWAELHEQIGALPDGERDVVELLFYQGLSQAEAAELLNISVRTVQRLWHSALWKLHQIWHGELPKA